MSWGSVIGAVVGAVVGWFIGGPVGALYGAGLGFGLGAMVDPMTPDIPSPGTPLPAGAEIMASTVGGPLPDLVGTAKITGHLLCFGKERVVTIEAKQLDTGKGGGGSSDNRIIGYDYHMSWAVGIVTGPVDTLYAIYKGDELVWEGVLDCPIDPDSHGQETVVLSDMGSSEGVPYRAKVVGSATFYFGTDTQVANSDVGEIIGDETLNSPYRNFCWCFFDDCCIGDFNRCPNMKFVVRKAPDIAFSEGNVIQMYDYNPAHAIWYIFHNLAGLPEEWLHTADFTAVASTLSSENRGISCLFLNQQNTLNYLGSINNHIDGIIRYDSDGKFHPKLIRDDYVVEDLPLIDENVMLDDPTLNRKSWTDTINEIKVQYTEIPRQISYPFPQGPWKAAMAYSSYIYVYDITYKAVVKLNTSEVPPFCCDSLVITEYDLDYDKGEGIPGAQRGGYCMNPGGSRLWYLVRNGLDCDLIEIDIAHSTMEIVATTSFPSLLSSGEFINDGCSDGVHTYWCTSLVAGRVIKIKNSDHSVSIDTTFNYPIVGTGSMNEPIQSIAVCSNKLYWIYSRDHVDCIPEYNACCHWIRSDIDLNQELDQIVCGSGFAAPHWQNLIRIHPPAVLIHRAYHPFCGMLTRTDENLGVDTTACKDYLQNIIGVRGDEVYILSLFAPYATSLRCTCLATLVDYKSKNVSEYTGHSPYDDCLALSTSALSDCGTAEVLALFRYSYTEETNIVTCFSADQSLTKLSEGVVLSDKEIEYGG